tara:strand:+ start:3754 stop:4509 length:756 start_codon:yes stop_codon:yes gene_type:complete
MNTFGNNTTKLTHELNFHNQLTNQLFKALHSRDSENALREMDDTGTLTTIIPELETGRNFIQPTLHYYDVLNHNLCTVGAFDRLLKQNDWSNIFRKTINWDEISTLLEKKIDGLPIEVLLRLGCLLHDVGKPESAIEKNGRIIFPKHGLIGAELISSRLEEIGLEASSRKFVRLLIRYHLRAGRLAQSWPPPKQSIQSFLQDVEGWVIPILLIQLADGMATKGPYQTLDRHYRYCEFFARILKLCNLNTSG